MSAINLTSASFNEVIASGRTLVDFWAGWCMPCRIVSPVIEELADEFKGRITVAKVNVENEGELAVRFGVQSIPTVILFENGTEINRFIGSKDKETYKNAIDN